MAERLTKPLAGLVALGALAALVVFPLGELFAAALADGPQAMAGLTGGALARPLVNTLWTSAVVVVLALTAATAAAWVTERSTAPGRRWLRLGLVLPLLVPPYVSALSWGRAYGTAGLSEQLTGVAVPGIYGAAGVVAVVTVNVMPLAYAIIAAALNVRAEPDLERAARASGASAWTAFRTTTLALLRPALVAAGALVFVGAANAFGVPAVLGRPAGFSTVTTRIYQDLVLSADPVAFGRVLLLSSLLVVVAFVVVGFTDLAVGLRFRAVRTGSPAGGAIAGPRPWLPALAIWAYLAVAVLLPLLALVLIALSPAVGVAPTPGNWTLANFAAVLAGPARQAAANSLQLAVGAAVGTLALGGLLAVVARQRWSRPLGTAAVLTFALPGSALAVAVLLAHGARLRDTLALILVAYLAKFWAIGHRSLAAGLDGIPPDLMRAAHASGARRAAAARTVTLPLLRPAIAAGGLLVFVFALHELTMSALLYGPGAQTLAVVILNLNQLGDVLATSALAVLLTAAVLAVAGPAMLLQRGRARPTGFE
ncbi:MAG: ABC transporter permease subunit [Egibacteraceae bacterium]